MTIGAQGVHHIGMSVPDPALARRFHIDLPGAVEKVAPSGWRDNDFFGNVFEIMGIHPNETAVPV